MKARIVTGSKCYEAEGHSRLSFRASTKPNSKALRIEILGLERSATILLSRDETCLLAEFLSKL